MLTLKDFFHLRQVEPILQKLLMDETGLIVVAGINHGSHLPSGAAGSISPSGRAGIFRILGREILEANEQMKVTVIAESKEIFRVPRRLKKRVTFEIIRPNDNIESLFLRFIYSPDRFLIVDQITPKNVKFLLKAAQQGKRVLAQLDTVFRGVDIARVFLDWNVPRNHLKGLRWVITMDRIPILCECKRKITVKNNLIEAIKRKYPHLEVDPTRPYFEAVGCDGCDYRGRRNEITTFDFYHSDKDIDFGVPSLFSIESYYLGLAGEGYIPLDDLLRIENDQLHRAYQLYQASEAVLEETRTNLGRKVVELEAANRVLKNRTEELISLQEIGQDLIGTTTLRDLARHVCRQASVLCGADRAIFYFRRDPDQFDVLATHGWQPGRIPRKIQRNAICEPEDEVLPGPFFGLPPGVKTVKNERKLGQGLRIPLVAQGDPVGAMIVHSTGKSQFQPGAVALLQTFANQAAVAIQRAGLIESLREKISQLEAAQVGLAQKERMDRELELAREVQQAVLPRTFPLVNGCCFSAQNKPARVVGGDFYDVISLDSGCFGLVIADVSDKGMPAAVYMALTRSLIVAEARREESPRKVLENVNDLLLELERARMFVTVFYGVLDTELRRLNYARAGHDYPLLIRGDEILELGGEGVILGYLESKQLHLSEESLPLVPGDRLVLYTDGLVDVLSPKGQRLKQGGLEKFLRRYANLPVAQLGSAIFEDVAGFQETAEQYDDMTLLAVEIQ